MLTIRVLHASRYLYHRSSRNRLSHSPVTACVDLCAECARHASNPLPANIHYLRLSADAYALTQTAVAMLALSALMLLSVIAMIFSCGSPLVADSRVAVVFYVQHLLPSQERRERDHDP